MSYFHVSLPIFHVLWFWMSWLHYDGTLYLKGNQLAWMAKQNLFYHSLRILPQHQNFSFFIFLFAFLIFLNQQFSASQLRCFLVCHQPWARHRLRLDLLRLIVPQKLTSFFSVNWKLSINLLYFFHYEKTLASQCLRVYCNLLLLSLSYFLI